MSPAPKGNMFNRIWKKPEDLKNDIDAYWDDCKENERPLTITGLALALDTSRHTLLNYENKLGKDFTTLIKRAKLMCENYAEEYLYSGKNVAGTIFNLKNNYGWIDQQDIVAPTMTLSELLKMRKERNGTGSGSSNE